jgi:hypothetical protein
MAPGIGAPARSQRKSNVSAPDHVPGAQVSG